MSAAIVPLPAFLFATCQVGAENALKQEVHRDHSQLRFAYSRPGFLTFKITTPVTPDFALSSIFARTWGFSLGKATGNTSEERVEAIRALFANLPIEQLHVWQRDLVAPRGLAPDGLTPEALALDSQLRIALAAQLSGTPSIRDTSNSPPLIADVVLVEPDQWWAGFHWARSVEQFWPGGQFPRGPEMELPVANAATTAAPGSIANGDPADPPSDTEIPAEESGLEADSTSLLPEGIISRGYFKMQEMLAWSELPLRRGQACIEIGCAPGGASQTLLARGLQVIGIDPAEMHPDVLHNPNFTHLQARPRDLRRKMFRGIPWLVCDINLPPNYTLDTLEEIVSDRSVQFEGMLITLKLPNWSLAEEIPRYLLRIRNWGFEHTRARQLQHNRQEICVAVTR